MSGAVAIPPGERVGTADQRLVRYGVPWSHFEVELALRGDRSSPRIAYLQGALEILSPSKDHERIKSYIGMLIETYALETGLDRRCKPFARCVRRSPADCPRGVTKLWHPTRATRLRPFLD